MFRIALFLIFTASIISCQPRFEKEITIQEIEDHIAYLASEDLKGRYPGTPEDISTGKYIAAELKGAGLILYEKTGIQPFGIATDIEARPGNSFTFGDVILEFESAFTPFSFSASGAAKAEVVFAGYGFQIEQEEILWNDYANVDVKD